MIIKNYIREYTMAIIFKGIAVVLVMAIVSGCDETQEVTTLENLVWSDEFDVDGAPNSANWTFQNGDGTDFGIPAGWGNNELQYYTDSSRNVIVQNGFLLITAQEEEEPVNGFNYTSTRMVTKDLREFQYGRVEARVKMPFGAGFFPAFWMLGEDWIETGWPQAGEIDIMEFIGDEPTQSFGTIHGPGYSGGESISKKFNLDNDRFDTGFHIFGIEWGENFINFYVDDVLYNQITPEDLPEDEDGNPAEWVYNKPFFILLNIAVGGNLPGSPTADTIFPQTMIVDYVRVYQ